MRTRILWEICKIGDLIAAPKITYDGDGDYARVRVEYAWWYRPFVRFGFWFANL